MKKEYSIFIGLSSDEVVALLHPILRRKGLLSDVPKNVYPKPLDEQEMSLEYHWEVEV